MSYRLCIVDGCELRGIKKGMCQPHRMRTLRGTDLTRPIQSKVLRPPVCALDFCDHKQYSLGYCQAHYRRIKNGVPESDLRPVRTRKRVSR